MLTYFDYQSGKRLPLGKRGEIGNFQFKKSRSRRTAEKKVILPQQYNYWKKKHYNLQQTFT